MIIGATLAAKTELLEDDSGEETTTVINNNKEQPMEDEFTDVIDNRRNNKNDKKPVSFFYGQQSHSVFNSNGNGIVVSSRFDSNGREEKYISIGTPKIRIDGEHFSCTNLTCPKNAFKCHVTSEAIANDRNKMKTKAECIDEEDKVIKDTEYEEVNPYPQATPPFSRVASVNRNGSISIEDSTGRNSFNVKKLSKEEQEALNKELELQNKRMNELFTYQQRLFQQQMEELNRQLQTSFGPNFPFGNYNPFIRPSFGFSGFPFGSNWPFGSFGIRNSYPFENNYNDNPFRDDVNFDTIEINRPTNTLYVETSHPHESSNYNPHDPPQTNYNNPHNPHSINPYMPHRPSKNFQSEFDESNENDNEIFDDTTNRIMVNNMYNRNNEKYRYAHRY